LTASLISLPTVLTLSRIACIPIIVGLFFIPAGWAAWLACGVFTLAAMTDYFDGYLARQRAEVSALGKLLDPIADKMLVAAVLLVLVGFGQLSGISILPALIILMREILVSGMREFLAGFGGKGLPVSFLAKWKTVVQMVALGFLIVGDAGPDFLPVTLIGVIGIWAASVLTLITGWQYVREGLHQILQAPAAQTPAAKKAAAKSKSKRPSSRAAGTVGKA
jgi:cardiolipin synthase